MIKFIIGLLLFPTLVFSEVPGTEIKKNLQNELKTTYLQSLEKKWGNCGSSPESCISQRSDYQVLNLPKKEMCFPYTMCGFYNCMEEKYRCDEVGVNYFTKLAFPTCSNYIKNINEEKFSKVGVEWIFNVMVCLQKGLVNECEILGNCPVNGSKETQKKTCEHITEFTLSYHPGCYINSGIGVCKLPLKDKMAIWQTVNPYMTKREKEEAYKVIFQCFNPIKR
ncbi:MAG: hypothetical protein K2Q18_07185 [Bdellovibrionales bacterium]|nr:hypothetical protein [Bdellovibrionales bacterium]